MNKIVLGTLVMFFAVLLSGCDKGDPETKWDYYNSDVIISVRNVGGQNLLSAVVAGNLIGNDIKVEYGGQIYRLDQSGLTRASSPDLPEWYGLRWNGRRGDDAVLLFGEFSVDTRDYRGETFMIHWGDGTSDEITFDLYATRDDAKERPVVHEAIRLNGVLQSDYSLVVNIVK